MRFYRKKTHISGAHLNINSFRGFCLFVCFPGKGDFKGFFFFRLEILGEGGGIFFVWLIVAV